MPIWLEAPKPPPKPPGCCAGGALNPPGAGAAGVPNPPPKGAGAGAPPNGAGAGAPPKGAGAGAPPKGAPKDPGAAAGGCGVLPKNPGAGAGVEPKVVAGAGVDPKAGGAAGVDPNDGAGVDPKAGGAACVDPNWGGAGVEPKVPAGACAGAGVEPNAGGAGVEPKAGGAGVEPKVWAVLGAGVEPNEVAGAGAGVDPKVGAEVEAGAGADPNVKAPVGAGAAGALPKGFEPEDDEPNPFPAGVGAGAWLPNGAGAGVDWLPNIDAEPAALAGAKDEPPPKGGGALLDELVLVVSPNAPGAAVAGVLPKVNGCVEFIFDSTGTDGLEDPPLLGFDASAGMDPNRPPDAGGAEAGALVLEVARAAPVAGAEASDFESSSRPRRRLLLSSPGSWLEAGGNICCFSPGGRRLDA
jgi:hypothetical protein